MCVFRLDYSFPVLLLVLERHLDLIKNMTCLPCSFTLHAQIQMAASPCSSIFYTVCMLYRGVGVKCAEAWR
jgi:hypothetical protein